MNFNLTSRLKRCSPWAMGQTPRSPPQHGERPLRGVCTILWVKPKLILLWHWFQESSKLLHELSIEESYIETRSSSFNLGCVIGWYVGPSGVRALPLAAGINAGGHYFGPSGVCELPLAAGINVGGHYFRYIGPSGAVQTVSDSRRPLF